MSRKVNLYEAKTQLSALVEAAGGGEEIVIAKNGVAKARLVSVAEEPKRRVPSNAMGITFIADDFDEPDPEIERLFEGS